MIIILNLHLITQRFTRYHHYLPAVVVLGLSLCALMAIGAELNARHQQRLQDYFEFETHRIAMGITERMALYDQTLRSAAGFFAGSDNITRSDWKAFVEMQELDLNYPGIQGIGFSLWIPQAQLETHIQSMRKQGFPDYVVKPVGVRSEYSSIIYLEPFSGRNLRAFGYDMYSEPVRQEAMRRARDQGVLAYSGKVTLVQETSKDFQAGILSYLPIYRNGVIPQTLEQRQAALFGWVYCPYRMNDLLRGILGKDILALRLEIFDEDQLNNDGLLFDTQTGTILASFKPQKDALTQLIKLELGGHYWTLRFTSLPDFSKATKLEPLWLEVSTLLIISSLMFFMTVAYINARRNALVAEQLSESLRQSENRFRSLFENSPVAYLALDKQGTILDSNPQLADLLDCDTEELLDKSLLDFIPTDSSHEIAAKLQALNQYKMIDCELQLRCKDGKYITVILDGRLQKNKGKAGIIHCIVTNITERKRAENKLQLAARVFGEAHEGITITDANGVIIDANPTFCAITGFSREEVIGKNHRFLQSGKHDQQFYTELWHTLRNEGHWQGEIWNRKKSGELYVELLTISAMRDPKGEIVNFVGLFSDITLSKLQQQELEKLAHYDGLTQLPNRIMFADRFNQALAKCKREHTLLGVVYMDLDGFKQVNDSRGHEVGDNLLVEVAARIKNCIRENDTVSRLGGDEFALLMTSIESKEQCEQALQRIHAAVILPYLMDGIEVNIGVSSGVTLFPLDPSDSDYLLRHADQAMYVAKQQGRNRYVFYDPSKMSA